MKPMFAAGGLLAACALSLHAQPSINPGGVVGAGLSVPAQKFLSPGAIFSIFGSGFAPAGTLAELSSADISNGSLPTILAHVCVQVGGVKAPLFLVTPSQINAQVPSISTTGTTIQVLTGCDTSDPTPSNSAFALLEPSSPEFFYFQSSTSGDNPVAAVDATAAGAYVGPGDASLPFATTPVNPGDIVVVYATGLGASSPATPPGVLAPAAAPLASPYTVYLAGQPLPAANLLYAGVAPSYAGLYQLNIRIPATAPAGPQSLAISVAGVSSPAGATLYIASGGCNLPQIDSFTAIPQQLSASGSTQISWYVAGATSVSTQPSLGSNATSSQVASNVSSTTAFQLTATNACGSTSATLTVGVGAPTIANIQNTAGQPISSAFSGDTLRLGFSNLGDPTMIQNIVFTAPNGLPYGYPPTSIDAQGHVYITAPVLPEMGFGAATAVQVSALTVAGQTIASNLTLNISLPVYSGNAVQDFTAYVNGLAAGYQSALNDLGSVSSDAAAVAPGIAAAVTTFLQPLQTALAQLASSNSATLQILPATASNPTPGTVTISAQDVGLLMALLARASVPVPAATPYARSSGQPSTSMHGFTAKSEVAHAATSCNSIQDQLPVIPKCQRLQQVNEYLEKFNENLKSLGTVAGLAGAVGALYQPAVGLNLVLAGGYAGILGLVLADADALASVYCFLEPIWLQDMIVAQQPIPNITGLASPTSSKLDVYAILESRINNAAATVGEALTETAASNFYPFALDSLISANNEVERELEKQAGEYWIDQVINGFNDVLKDTFTKLSVPVSQRYVVGYCAEDLRNVTFPTDLSKPDLNQPNFGYNDFFVFGTQEGTGPAQVIGSQNNFLFSDHFRCGLFADNATFLCSPNLTVGPPANVIASSAEVGTNNCSGTSMFVDPSRLAVNTQPLGYAGIRFSSESSPETAFLNAYQSLPNDWEFQLISNFTAVSNSPACFDSDFADATVSSLSQLSLTITYSVPVTVSISATDCPVYSVTPMVGLTSLTSDHSQDKTLNGSGNVTWTLTGSGVVMLSANAGLSSRVSVQQNGQVCEISGGIEFAEAPPGAAARQ